MEKRVDTQQNPQPNGFKKLNVILHGAYSLDQTTEQGRILALIPYIPYHAYRAGNWLAETELRGRTNSSAVVYKLLGVSPGNARFDLQQNLVVKPNQPAKPQSLPYATLRFPIPDKISSLLVAQIPRSSFSDPQELVGNSDPQPIATLHVFTYDFDDENALMLKADDGEGHYWEPFLNDGYVNLHIFSAEDHYHKPTNSMEDFNQCADLIGGLDLRLQTRLLPASGILPTQKVPGVNEWETESLALRTERMARLGRLVTQGADARLAWNGTNALDGDPEACGGPIC
jgi:hypothetical protein